MSKSTPILYVFAISHYCEKARWALDYLGTEFKLRHLAPGEHRKHALKWSGSVSSLPYLRVGDRLIKGSGSIISWAQQNAPPGAESLLAEGDPDLCRQIEERIDAAAGVHIRRYYYSEALVEHPRTVQRIFTKDLPFPKNIVIKLAWGKIRGAMIRLMDLGHSQGLESKAIVEGELDWIDGLLGDGRQYLVGNSLSRADIAVASLLAPLALPDEHPVYNNVMHPPRLAQDVASWNQRPSLRWVRELYAKHRRIQT